MEGERSYQPRRESFLERYFFLDRESLERHTEIDSRELSRLSYSVEQTRFRRVSENEPRRDVEILWHRETSTLIVPPPASGTIHTKDLATMALPVVGFIEQQRPDIVIGCDRGARIYAVTVHSMWSNFKAREQRFPTLDARLHFARLSTSLGSDITSQVLAKILEASIKEAEIQKKGFNGDRLKIMFIDDWISSGATRRHILKSLKAINVLSKVDVCFAVMCGGGADVAGTSRRVSVPWHDNPEVIGINYTRDGKPFPVRTEQALQIRRKVHMAAKELATKLK